MACFLIAYSLCGTHRAHTNCRLQSPTLRVEDCKCIHALASPIIARSCNIRASCYTCVVKQKTRDASQLRQLPWLGDGSFGIALEHLWQPNEGRPIRCGHL
jgi:hypothetical protein